MIRFVPETCFRLLFLVGMFCLLCGGATHPAVAAATKLDVVLSPDELKDPQMVATAKAFLSRSEAGFQWIVWLVVGAINMIVSVVGLYSYLPAQAASVRAWSQPQ